MILTTTTMTTLDGVMQGPGGADEDRRGGFDWGGWIGPYATADTMGFINSIYGRADAFLFGRFTYDLFADYWGGMDDPGNSPVWTSLNTRPKYLASTTTTDPAWDRTTVLGDDLVTAIAELKATPGGELQVHGSGVLVRWLLEHELVDQVTLIVAPTILGQGTRLFPETGPDHALDVLRSQTTANGVTHLVLRPDGKPRYATAGG